ncbi:MAG: DUF6687 family protein [Acidimicrobiales bacterium]
MPTHLRYEPYERTTDVPNVVVDGSPNPSTVLTLTHWPGFAAPTGLAADLSAQMAFRYLDRGRCLHQPADVVTNNHFDQDGLVGVFVLTRPDEAVLRRDLLQDLAAAGDFATYRDRRAARLSMVVAAYVDPVRSPLAPLPAEYGESSALLYRELLGRLPELLDRPEAHRPLWAEEDGELSASEAAIARGDVVIEEHPEVDLTVVTLGDKVRDGGWAGHRFAGRRFEGVHPMALHNATDRLALLLVQGRRYRFTYRYETWVQYRSRPTRPRVDLTALATRLTSEESGTTIWRADPVQDLTPQLGTVDGAESSLAPSRVVAHVTAHLRDAPPTWDPYRIGDPGGAAA